MMLERFQKKASKTESGMPAAERQTSFENQWSRPAEVRIGDEKFSAFDVRPEGQEKTLPIIITPGWSHTAKVWQNTAREYTKAGYRTLCMNAPHGSDKIVETENIQNAELRRVSALLQTLESRGIAKSDAFGHSEGAITLLLAAHIAPEKFRTLVLSNPGGLIGPDSFLDLAGRFGKEKLAAFVRGYREGTLSRMITSHVEGAKSVSRHPAHSLNEVLAMARTDLVHLLRELKSKGIRIVIIHSPEDPVFPFARMSKTISTEKEIKDRLGENRGPDGQLLDGEILKLLDGVYSVKGGHEESIYRSEQYAHVALDAFDAAEKKLP